MAALAACLALPSLRITAGSWGGDYRLRQWSGTAPCVSTQVGPASKSKKRLEHSVRLPGERGRLADVCMHVSEGESAASARS